jgi:hypothetical protein
VLPALASGATTTLTFSVPTAGFSGMVALVALADRAGTVAEYSEVNNRRSALLDVRPPGSPPPPDGDGNRPPIITSLPPTGGRIGQPFIYQVVAQDPEGGPLRYELPVAIVPGMTLGPDSGLFTWTPAGPVDVYAAVIVVRDAQGAAATQRLEIRVLGSDDKSPPQFDSAPLSVARPGGLYQYTAQATDPDGGAVVLSAPQMPAGMTFEPGTGLLRWTPAAGDVGEHAVRLLAWTTRALGRAGLPGDRLRARRRGRARPDGASAWSRDTGAHRRPVAGGDRRGAGADRQPGHRGRPQRRGGTGRGSRRRSGHHRRGLRCWVGCSWRSWRRGRSSR